jgi:threonine aldolase
MVNESVYVELRSDTFTQPTKEMVAEMMAAEVGDSIYNEDPTMNSNFCCDFNFYHEAVC